MIMAVQHIENADIAIENGNVSPIPSHSYNVEDEKSLPSNIAAITTNGAENPGRPQPKLQRVEANSWDAVIKENAFTGIGRFLITPVSSVKTFLANRERFNLMVRPGTMPRRRC
jgi:hypothetical protein